MVRFANKARIAEVTRGEGGAVICLFKDDVHPQEMAAMMLAITNAAREMGISPGRLFQEYSALAAGQQLITPGGLDAQSPN